MPRSVAALEAETVGLHFDLTSDAKGSISVSTIPDGAEVKSKPSGASVYIDYLPTTNVTDITVDWLDAELSNPGMYKIIQIHHQL